MHGGPNVDSYALYIKPDAKAIGLKPAEQPIHGLT